MDDVGSEYNQLPSEADVELAACDADCQTAELFDFSEYSIRPSEVSVEYSEGLDVASMSGEEFTALSAVTKSASVLDTVTCQSEEFSDAVKSELDELHLTDFLNTAESEVSTAAQRTDSVCTGISNVSMSPYSDHTFDEVDVSMTEIYKFPHLELPERSGIDTPNPETVNQSSLLP